MSKNSCNNVIIQFNKCQLNLKCLVCVDSYSLTVQVNLLSSMVVAERKLLRQF